MDFKQNSSLQRAKKILTGNHLRNYAFTLLTQREYSKAELLNKLKQYADEQEVIYLINELAEQHYQSDQRVAEQLLSSQIRKGKGIYRIKQALQAKGLNHDLIEEDLHKIDWFKQAYQLKVKKFGAAVTTEPKMKAKQIRFLQYRGFTMDIILKVIQYEGDK